MGFTVLPSSMVVSRLGLSGFCQACRNDQGEFRASARIRSMKARVIRRGGLRWRVAGRVGGDRHTISVKTVSWKRFYCICLFIALVHLSCSLCCLLHVLAHTFGQPTVYSQDRTFLLSAS